MRQMEVFFVENALLEHRYVPGNWSLLLG
jgi:hypothetical protein